MCTIPMFRSFVVAAALLAPLAAQTITGRVVSAALVPIAGIVVDAGSGSIPATTDPLGVFTILGLQVGNDYDVEFVPPFAAPWAAHVQTVVVTGAVNLGDVVLQPGFAVSGVAMTEASVGILGCNVNVYDQAGTKLFTPRDGSDATGAFSVTVPAGTWDVRVVPPVGALLVPKQVEDVVVAAPVALGTVTLKTAHLVTGSVVDATTSVPIGNARLKIVDALTGARILVPNDTTNLFGQFTLPLPWGIADIDVEPPVGNTHVARQVFGVLVGGPLALGQVRLQNGTLWSGTVYANGLPLAGADVDVLLPDGTKVFTPHDTTAANGTFSVAVPTGTALRTRVEAPAGTTLYGTVTAPVTPTGPTNVGLITLQNGLAVGGTCSGVGGPEAGVSVRFFDATTNTELVTTGSHSDAAGQWLTHVPAGTWRIEARTAEGSVRARTQQTVTIAGPATVNFTLADKLARTALTSFGTPTIPVGSLLPVNVLLHSMVPGWQSLLVDVLVEMPNGAQTPLVLGLPLDLPPLPLQIDFVWLPIPPVAPADLGRVLEMVVRLRDAAGTVVLDEAKTPFVVQ